MADISPIRGMADPQRFPNITDQEQARILSTVLYWISARAPENDASLLQGTWSQHAKKYQLTSAQMAEDLPSMIGMLVNTAYQDRGTPIASAYAHVKTSPARSVIIDKGEQARLRETLTPQILGIVEGMERGEISPRDVLARAMAIGTLSNNTAFRASDTGMLFQPGASGYVQLAINDAYGLIDRGTDVPEGFDRHRTVADILSARDARRDEAMAKFRSPQWQPTSIESREPAAIPLDIKPIHPLTAQRNNPSHWYNTTDMSDLLAVAQAGKANVACMQFWNSDAQVGVDKDGNTFDSVDGRAVYVLPSISATALMGGTPAAEARTILEKWREENPQSKPKGISMILRVGDNHYTTLSVSPNPDNPGRADIAYVNPFGNNSGYAREDQAVIAAVKNLYPDAETTVVTNGQRLQHDGSSCGPLSIAHLIALGDADNPSDLIRTGNLAGQDQVMALRNSQGAMLEHERAGVHRDAMSLRDEKATEAGHPPVVQTIQWGASRREGRPR